MILILYWPKNSSRRSGDGDLQFCGLQALCGWYRAIWCANAFSVIWQIPKWEKVTVWLKILEKGDANLYVFVYGNITKYFYDTKDLPAKQLLYLRYLDKSDGETLPGYEERYMKTMNTKENCLNIWNVTPYRIKTWPTLSTQKSADPIL
jgi:hypothetical protein